MCIGNDIKNCIRGPFLSSCLPEEDVLKVDCGREGGIYIHIPFCSSRCGYCGFFTAGSRIADWPRFASSLADELALRSGEIPDVVRTIYFGGGTPSQMPAETFVGLMESIRKTVCDSGHRLDLNEVTVESNPDDVTPELADAWKSAGVNRVSLGIQSFIAEELRVMERRHNPDHVAEALETLRSRFGNISADLIFGLPGQTLSDWRYSLEKALSSGITHLSAYSLSFEERSLLTYRKKHGEIKEAEDVDTAAMYSLLLEITAGAGLRHYEVSNFALPGFESRHNSSYWSGLPYIGIGPSASSYDGARCRKTNACNVTGWIGKEEVEILTDDELLMEYVMTRMRRAEGIDVEDMKLRFGEKTAETVSAKAAALAGAGLVTVADGRIKVADKGWMVHDYICTELF